MSPLFKVKDLTHIGQYQGHKQGQTPKGTPSEVKILKATMTEKSQFHYLGSMTTLIIRTV